MSGANLKLAALSAAPVAAAAINRFQPAPIAGRGRGRAALRRGHGWRLDPDRFRAGFCGQWGALLRHLFVSREAVAVHFGVTFQCACNWWDGQNRPSGDKVAMAAIAWPEDFARFMGAV